MLSLKELKELSTDISILYVEDDMRLREHVSTYLKLIFKRVDSAEDGAIGLELFKKTVYDIVITDIQMPKMNGLEMVSAIRELKKNQAVLITSAYGDSDYLMQSIALDIDGYIIKPIEFDKINETLYKIVTNINLHKENENYKINLEELVKERTAQNSLLQEEKIQNYEKTLLSLVELVEMRDTYTGGHSLRVANYSKLIATNMGYDEEYCELLYKAGILHDIGKIGTPDAVLLKPGKLDTFECSVMQEHVSVSAELLSKIPMYEELSGVIAAHHEYYDGNGYPKGLKKDEIPELARIMTVADAFDAMTTSRIYKGRMEVVDAIQELQKFSGTQFDPKVVMSAIEVLKDIKVDENIFQLPSSEMEHKRFAYFYKDQTTAAYNQEYLDLVLTQSSNTQKRKYISLVLTHNFASYNNVHGWGKGNLYLQKIVKFLKNYSDDVLVFRVHGNDFVVISDNNIEIDMSLFIYNMAEENKITFTYKGLDSVKDTVDSFSDLEKYM